MNTLFTTFLSMSFSGACLILLLFLGKRLWRNKVSRQWQYYIWLVVVLRLLLPFGAEISVINRPVQSIYQSVAQAVSPAQTEKEDDTSGNMTKMVNLEESLENDWEITTVLRRFVDFLTAYGGWLWIVVALAMLLRKITVYQSFVEYVKAGAQPVSDLALLDDLSIAAKEAGVTKPVELCVNPLVSSPLVIGFLRPAIVLQGTELSEEAFHYIALHELTHCRRWDVLYKWLVQIAVCLHWFNPLVYLMSREITAACEFSCDEAVLKKVGYDSAQAYGKTLLDAMAAVGKYKESLCAVTLSENKRILKERLETVMSLKKKSRAVRILTTVLTFCFIFGASFLFAYPVTAQAYQSGSVSEKVADRTERDRKDSVILQAQQFYEAGSLPLFENAFSRMNEETQEVWLNRIYEDGEIAFFSVSVNQLAVNSPLIGQFAEKFYEDEAVSFFSVLADCMGEKTLEEWLDRALKDGTVSAGFQAMLFDKLDKDAEFDAWEEEQAEKQLAEYAAYGVTKAGKDYYYQGQMVNIFLDHRPDSSFYTLNINPLGAVNIKILRGADGKITGVAYMTEVETEELLGDWDIP